MALLYIFTGHKPTDQLMENLDLSYMSKDKYGQHFQQMQGSPAKLEDIDPKDRIIHVLAHGNDKGIAGESGEKFAQRLLDTFKKEQLENRKILVYACNVAEGHDKSVLHAMLEKLVAKNVTKTTLVGSVDETFTMSTGTMRVLKHSNQSDQLSKTVEGKKGQERDKLAEPYLRDFQQGWRGYKIRGDGKVVNLSAEEAGAEIPKFD